MYLSDSVDGLDKLVGIEDEDVAVNGEKASEARPGSQLPAFSGAFTSAQVRDVFETEMDQDNSSERYGTSTIFEEAESISVGEVMKSPVLSEDESSDNSFWIDLGQSPLGSEYAGQTNKQKIASPLPPYWFTGRKNNKRISPKPTTKLYGSPLYDEKNGPHELGHVISFDAAVLSVSQELDRLKEVPEEEQFGETSPPLQNGKNSLNHLHSGEIQEEPGVSGPLPTGYASNFGANGSRLKDFSSTSRHHGLENGTTSEICSDVKESAIRRETEGEFRL